MKVNDLFKAQKTAFSILINSPKQLHLSKIPNNFLVTKVIIFFQVTKKEIQLPAIFSTVGHYKPLKVETSLKIKFLILLSNP
jgi:hypothetical protein